MLWAWLLEWTFCHVPGPCLGLCQNAYPIVGRYARRGFWPSNSTDLPGKAAFSIQLAWGDQPKRKSSEKRPRRTFRVLDPPLALHTKIIMMNNAFLQAWHSRRLSRLARWGQNLFEVSYYPGFQDSYFVIEKIFSTFFFMAETSAGNTGIVEEGQN